MNFTSHNTKQPSPTKVWKTQGRESTKNAFSVYLQAHKLRVVFINNCYTASTLVTTRES